CGGAGAEADAHARLDPADRAFCGLSFQSIGIHGARSVVSIGRGLSIPVLSRRIAENPISGHPIPVGSAALRWMLSLFRMRVAISMVPTVVFDLDGTLVDTAPDLVATLNAVFADNGWPPVEFVVARNSVGGGARRMIERALAHQERFLPNAEVDRIF